MQMCVILCLYVFLVLFLIFYLDSLFFILFYIIFHLRIHTFPCLSFPCLKRGQGILPCGKPKALALHPGLGSFASQYTRFRKSQYVQKKQVPVALSMASQSAAIVRNIQRYSLITCSVLVSLDLLSSH